MRTDIRSEKFDGYDASDGMPRTVEAICRHISDGQKLGDLAQLTKVVSANYYIDKGGVIYELVPPDHCAWTNGQLHAPDLTNSLIADWVQHGWNPNTRTVSIEHEGHRDDHFTKPQWESTLNLGAWLSQEYNLPCDRIHNIGHYQIDSVNRPYCPGLTAAEWDYLVTRQNELLNGVADDNPWYFQETKKYIAEPAFQDLFLLKSIVDTGITRDQALTIWGYPVSGSFNEAQDDKTILLVQYFERAVYQKFSDGRVETRLLGTDELARRHPDGAPA
jgi:N-acetyl-anhydromuramyl-L-alanine amidase AmpD